MCLMIRAILYPGAQIFVASGGKEQSANILESKVREIVKLIPALENEIIWDTRATPGAKTRRTKDSVAYSFKNGSVIENVSASEKTRGRRAQSLLCEEVIGIDDTILNEVLLPTLNVERRVNGQVDPDEVFNQSQVYVTTAGFKSSFSYQKLIQLLCMSIAKPDKAIVLGGSWRTPVMEGLLNRDFVADLMSDGTFNEASFEREYRILYSINY